METSKTDKLFTCLIFATSPTSPMKIATVFGPISVSLKGAVQEKEAPFILQASPDKWSS